MFKRLIAFAVLGLTAATCAQAQDQPQQPQSLGEIARQARKSKEEREKASGAPKVVVTDDTLGSSRGGALAFGQTVDGKAPFSEALANAEKQFDRADKILDMLDPMDKATLARLALQGRDVDFPGRSNWEDKLHAAKQSYVSHGRDLVREAREFVSNAQSLRASGASENDPRVQDLFHRALQIMHDASRTDADFEAILLQGQDMAKQAVTH